MKEKLLLGILLIASFGLFLHPIDSGDFFHHLNTGRYIVENKSLPDTDTWSFTAYGKPWYAHSWGSGWLFYGAYKWLGLVGINVLLALLGSTMILWLYLMAKRYEVGSLMTVMLLWLVAGLLSMYWPSRPLVLGPWFMALLLLLLSRYRRWRYGLPVFFFLWGVMYGASTFLGLGIFTLYLISNKQLSGRDLLVLGLSAVAAGGNGYGLNSVFYVLLVPSMLPRVQEWLPLIQLIGQTLLPIVQYKLLVYGAWLVLMMVMVGLMWPYRGQFFKQYRFFAFLALGVLGPFLSFRLFAIVPVLSFPLLVVVTQFLTKQAKAVAISTATMTMVLVMLVRGVAFPFGVGMEHETALKQLTAFLRVNKIFGNTYVSQDLGAYITWEVPESKIFYDTRDELFEQTEVFDHKALVNQGKMSMTELLDRYKAEIVIGKPGNSIYQPVFASQEWETVYQTEAYFVAIRKNEV